MFDIPIELFLGLIVSALALAVFGLMRNPQMMLMLLIAGVFIFTLTALTDNIIMGKIPESSTVSGATTTYTLVDNPYPLTDMPKMLIAMIGAVLMLIGAVFTIK